MNLIVSHPTANQNVRAAVKGFVDAGINTMFQTTIASFPGDFLSVIGSLKIFSSLSRRQFDLRLRQVTKTWPWLEMGRLLSQRVGIASLTTHETGLFSIDSVYKNLDHIVANRIYNVEKDKCQAVYAYEDGALCSFTQARKKGIRCYYDLPIGYWRVARDIFEQEKLKWPEWISTLNGLKNSEGKLLQKDQEILLADKIYVASTFTAKTLQAFPKTVPPVEVIPYGFPPVTEMKEYPRAGVRKLKLLFVGSLSQRKGVANLFAAVNGLERYVSLTVVGRKVTDKCVPLNSTLNKHHWIPGLPHNEILQLMRSHDVLVFPSLFEGFGLVITEAMSQGTPVITTERTAGPDFIKHGRNGWIIEAGSTEALRDMIQQILANPKAVAACGYEALETARSRPWQTYAHLLAKSVMEPFKHNP